MKIITTKIYFTILFILCSLSTSPASESLKFQKDTIKTNGKISGVVMDKDNNIALNGVAIQLLHSKDNSVIAGTESGTDGRFVFENVSMGVYNLKVDLVGYSNALIKGITVSGDNLNINLDPIKLKSGSVTTEEIIVEAEKSPIELRPDKKVFNVEGNMITQGGSAIDVLKNVPSVSVDVDGNISLRGSQNVKIIVDGKPFGLPGSNLATLLEQIPANQISSIELITNPSAKYEAEGTSGIINIVLKKAEGFDYNGSFSLNAGTKDKYSGTINLNLRNNKLRLSGNYDYRLFNFTIQGVSNRDNFLSSTSSFLNQQSNGRIRNINHFSKAGLDYNINERNSISITGNYTDRNRTRNETTETKQLDANNILNENYFFKINEKTDGYNMDFAFNYTLRFKNPKQLLTSDITYFKLHDDINTFTNQEFVQPINNTPEKQNQINIEDNNETNAQIDYTHPFSEDTKFETGYKGVFRKSDKDYTTEDFNYNTNLFELNPALSNRFIYKEQIHGAYALFTSKIKNFSYQIGLRGEQTFSNGDLITTQQKFDNDYFGLFPSASISQKLGKAEEVQLSYSRRINRPSLQQLNPFVNTSDPLNYFSGNPNLKPEYINSFELNFIKYFTITTITSGIFYRQTKDQLSRTRVLIDSNISLTSFTNYGRSKTYGAELILSTSIWKFWNLNGSMSYFNTDIDAENLQQGFVNDGYSWSGRINSTMRLPDILDIMFSYFYSGRIVIAQGELAPFQSFDISLKKDFLNNQASISLRVSDVFNKLKFNVILDGSQFSENLFRKRDTRAAFLTFTYKFGQADKNEERRRRRDSNQDNQNDGMGF